MNIVCSLKWEMKAFMGRRITFKLRPYEKITDADVITKPEQSSQDMLDSLTETETALQHLYVDMASSADPSEYTEDVNAKLRSYRRSSNNLAKAYQRNAVMIDELSARHKDLMKGKKIKIIPKAPANSVIDLEESRSKHFAKGLNIYKILMIGYIGSFAGVVIEMLWCLLTRGYIESRAGLVYGPFNLLYGAGAVVMTLSLYAFRNKGRWISFLGGFAVGSVVEYVCSWWQETFFGSRSWDYSQMPFNLNGRICLLYSIFWGFLGVLWVKTIYPWMAKLILKLPEKLGKILTWAFLVFFIFNAIVTVIAVFRWSQRLDMIDPTNDFWKFIDTRFPNERMERIFSNMVFE